MRDAAGQPADALHPLGLLQLVRELGPFRFGPHRPVALVTDAPRKPDRKQQKQHRAGRGRDHDAHAPPGLDERGTLLHAPSGEIGPSANQLAQRAVVEHVRDRRAQESAASADAKVAPIPR